MKHVITGTGPNVFIPVDLKITIESVKDLKKIMNALAHMEPLDQHPVLLDLKPILEAYNG